MSIDLSAVAPEVEQDAPAVATCAPHEILPCIKIFFDPDKHAIAAIDFKGSTDPNPEFKTWDYIAAVLSMAIKAAERFQKQQEMVQMMAVQNETQKQLAMQQQKAIQEAHAIQRNGRQRH